MPDVTHAAPHEDLEASTAAARGTAALLGFQMVARALALVFVMVATRVIAPDEFAEYSIAASLVLMGSYFADAGTTPAVIRLISRGSIHSDHAVSRTLPLSLGTGIVSALGVMTFALLAGYPRTTLEAIGVGALAIPASSALTTILAGLDGRGLLSRRAVISAAQTAIVAIGGIAALIAGFGALGAVVPIALAPWILLPVATVVARKADVWTSRPAYHHATLRTVIGCALPFAATGVLTTLTARFDVVLLSILSTPADTATYDVAQRMLESFGFLSAAVTVPALFLFNKRLAGEDLPGFRRAYDRAVAVLLAISLPVGVCGAILSDSLTSLVFGPDYSDVALPVAILLLGLPVSFVLAIQGTVASSYNRLRLAVALAAITLAITAVLDLLLISTWGATGAAIALLLGWTLSLVPYEVVQRRRTGARTHLPSGRLVLAVALPAAACITLRTTPLLALPVAGLFYAIGALCLGVITSADLSAAGLPARFSQSRWVRA